MKNFAPRWLGLGVLALALPLAAAAQEAYTRDEVNLRAGPSVDYPLVAQLGPGQPLNVVGCTDDYGWCDVVLPDGLRGWAAASRLEYSYRGEGVPLATYGATLGVPIVGFAIGSYWGEHYRDRPWYGERRWWGGRPPPQPGWRPPAPAYGGGGWVAPPPQPQPAWQGRPPGAGYGQQQPGYPRDAGPGYRPDRGDRPHNVPVPGVRLPMQTVPVPVPVPGPQYQAPQPRSPNAFPGPFDKPRSIDLP